MSHPEGMPINPEGEVSPDDISRLVHTAQALLPPPTLEIYQDENEEVADDELISEPVIEEIAEVAFVLLEDEDRQVFVTIHEYDSTNGRHEISISKITHEYEQRLGAIQVKDIYDVDLHTFEPSYNRITRPIRRSLEPSIPKTIEEREAEIMGVLANATLAYNLGLNRFTESHFEEVMRLLDQCGPHNSVPLK